MFKKLLTALGLSSKKTAVSVKTIHAKDVIHSVYDHAIAMKIYQHNALELQRQKRSAYRMSR